MATLLLEAGTRPVTSSRLDLMRTRPDFVLRLDRDGVRRLFADMLDGKVACCETSYGWCVWMLEGKRA